MRSFDTHDIFLRAIDTDGVLTVSFILSIFHPRSFAREMEWNIHMRPIGSYKVPWFTAVFEPISLLSQPAPWSTHQPTFFDRGHLQRAQQG